jgi:hypothetical protein
MVDGRFDDGWLGVVNVSRSLEGLDVVEGDGLEGVDDEGVDDLEGADGLELPELEGDERVKEPPLLRPALLFA